MCTQIARKLAGVILGAGLALACATPPPGYVSQLSEREQRVHGLLLSIHADEFAKRLERFAIRATGSSPEIRRVFDPDDLMLDLTEAVSRDYDSAAVGTLQTFFASDLGKRVSEALATPSRFRGRTGYALATGPSIDPDLQTERVKTIEGLDGETQALRTAERVYLTTYEALLRRHSRPRGGLPRAHVDTRAMGMSERELETRMQEAREVIDRTVEEHFLPLALYAFRDLSDIELDEFVALMASKSGRWFVGSARQALLDAVERRAALLQGDETAWNPAPGGAAVGADPP